MKKLKIELTVLVLVILVFAGIDDIALSNYALMVRIVCIFAACADVFMLADSYEKYKAEKSKESQSTTELLLSEQKRIDRLFSQFDQSVKELVSNLSAEMNQKSTEEKKLILECLQDLRSEQNFVLKSNSEELGNEIEKLEQNLLKAMQSLVDVQNKNTDTVAGTIESSKAVYDMYMTEIRKMNQIQERLVIMEEKNASLNGEVLSNINEAITRFVQVSEAVKDQVSALKAYSVDFTNKIKVSMSDHYQNINDKIEDGIDDLEEILKEYSDKQAGAYDDQTKALVKCIENIERMIDKSIGEVMEKNDHLLTYIEKVQDEWTSLNKDEIEFLNRIWEEK